MCKGIKRHDYMIMCFAVCWMIGVGLLLFTIQPPSASAMLQELTVPGVTTEPLTRQDPVAQAVGAGEQTVTALAEDPASPVIPEQVVPSAPIEAPIKTPDDIAEPETSSAQLPQLFLDLPAVRVQTPVVKADTNELQQAVRSLPDQVHTKTIKKPTVPDEAQPAVNQAQPDGDGAQNSQTKISVSRVSPGKPHQRKQSHGVPRLPLNEMPSLFPAQAVGTPQVTTASGGGNGGQASGYGSAGSAAWWVAVPEPSLFGDPNESSERIAARYLLGFDQWCQPPPEEPPMEGFFSNF